MIKNMICAGIVVASCLTLACQDASASRRFEDSLSKVGRTLAVRTMSSQPLVRVRMYSTDPGSEKGAWTQLLSSLASWREKVGSLFLFRTVKSDKEMHFTGIQTFKTLDLCAHVHIDTSGVGNEIKLKFSGPKEKHLDKYLENIVVTSRNGMLTLKHKKQSKYYDASSSVIVTGWFSRVNMRGGILRSWWRKHSMPPLPTLNVTISPSLGLILDGAAGNWTIGDTKARFKARLAGACTMDASRITSPDTDIEVCGASHFSAKEIKSKKLDCDVCGSGTITLGSLLLQTAGLNVSGSGKIKIGGGRIGDGLSADVSGSGKIDLGGVVRNAVLNVGGSGKIYVDEVEGDLDRDISGSGEIRVGLRAKKVMKKT